MYQDAIGHPAFDSFWKSISTREQLDKIKVPVFSVGGWYDNFVESDLEAYAALRKNSSVNRILIGPWPHNMSIKFAKVGFRSGGDGAAADAADGVVRPVVERQGYAAAFEAAGADIRDGREPLARGAGMAARARPADAVLPGEPRTREYARTATARWSARPPAHGGAGHLRVRSAQSRADARRRGVLQPEGVSLGADGSAPGGAARRTCWCTPRRR